MARRKHRSNVRYARVPSGGETCPFCMMLASRGAVYHTEESAGDAGHYHTHCRCRIVPVWGDSGIEGYDPEEWYRKWQQAEKEEKDRKESQGRKKTTEEGSTVAAGVSASVDPQLRAWARQFPNEELYVELANGELFHKEGNPLGVTVYDKDTVSSFADGKAKHTHTTPIGGTFGEDDVNFTVAVWLKEHEVEATQHGVAYKLVRTDRATKESAEAFRREFEHDVSKRYDELLGEAYDASGGDKTHGYGPTLEDELRAEKMTAAYRHEWLSAHAGEYGYEYSYRAVEVV